MSRKAKNDQKFLELTKEIDVEKLRLSIQSEFQNFPDPRDPARITYPAWYLILIILCGYLAGSNTPEALASYAKLKKAWLLELTGIAVGAPSHNTLWWFFVRVTPDAFKKLLTGWFQRLPRELKGQLLAVDGKRLRGASKQSHISHIVELFATEDRLVIAQSKVPDKKGEAQALPELLNAVDIKGAIVSLDALYCNIEDTQEVLNRGADYIVGIKGNQPTLHKELINYFEQAHAVNYEGVKVSRFESCEKGHGRIEERKVCVNTDLDWLPQKDSWGLNSVIEIRSERVVKGKSETSTRYYGSSCEASSRKFANWVRGHWSIENNLHWVADVVLREDASLSNSGNSAENLAIVRRLTMNIISEFDPDRGMAEARRCATHSPEYLRGILSKVFC
jgi:predicted transposase YbfD/YdcC